MIRRLLLLSLVLILVLPSTASGFTDELHVLIKWRGSTIVVDGPGIISYMPCNGSLTPFLVLTYVAPPGSIATKVSVDVHVVPSENVVTELHPALLRGNNTVYATACRPVNIYTGVWRGISITTIQVPLIRSDGVVVKLDVYLSGVDGVLKPRPTSLEISVLRQVGATGFMSSLSTLPKPFANGVIVLTRKYLLDVVRNWVRVKVSQGFKVRVVTVEEICGSPVVGRDLQEKIRNYIRNLYRSDPSYKYLVIIGDTLGTYYAERLTCDDLAILPPWDVPTRYFYNSISDADYGHSDGFVPSDWYYVTFDGSWDYDGDGIYGEYPDDAKAFDLYPELIVARVPTRTPQDVYNMLLSNAWSETKLTLNLVASILAYLNKDGLADHGDTRLEVLYQRVFSGFDWLRVYRLYEHYPTLQPIVNSTQINGNISRVNVTRLLSRSTGLTIVDAHGNEKCVYRYIWEEDFNGNGIADRDEIRVEPFLCSDDAYRLPPQHVIVAVACATAYYDNPSEVSLGEAFLERGVTVYIGWSRVTFGCLLTPTDELDPGKWCLADKLAYLLSSNLVDHGVSSAVGDALLSAVATLASLEYPALGEYYLRVFYTLTLLGDPTRHIYAQATRFTPQNATIIYGGNESAVLTLTSPKGPVSNAKVFVYAYRGGYDVSTAYFAQLVSDESGRIEVKALSYPVKLLVYYPGDRLLPHAYEPSVAWITSNVTIWLKVTPSVATPGSWVRIVGCGFTPTTVYMVMLESLPVGWVRSNASGCINARILMPLDLPPGQATLWLATPGLLEPIYAVKIVVGKSPVLATYDKLLTIEVSVNRLLTQVYTLTSIVRKVLAAVSNVNESIRAEIDAKIADVLNTLKKINETINDRAKSIEEKIPSILKGLENLAKSLEDISRMVRDVKGFEERLGDMLRAIIERTHVLESSLKILYTELLVNRQYVAETARNVTGGLTFLGEEIASLNLTLRSMRSELLNLTNIVQSYRRLLARMSTEHEELQKSIRELGTRVDRVMETLNTILENASLVAREVRSTRNYLNITLSILSSKLDGISAKVSDVKTEVSRKIDIVADEITASRKLYERLWTLASAIEATIVGFGIATLALIRFRR